MKLNNVNINNWKRVQEPVSTGIGINVSKIIMRTIMISIVWNVSRSMSRGLQNNETK